MNLREAFVNAKQGEKLRIPPKMQAFCGNVQK
jgi:hypothetical protein